MRRTDPLDAFDRDAGAQGCGERRNIAHQDETGFALANELSNTWGIAGVRCVECDDQFKPTRAQREVEREPHLFALRTHHPNRAVSARWNPRVWKRGVSRIDNQYASTGCSDAACPRAGDAESTSTRTRVNPKQFPAREATLEGLVEVGPA